VEAGIQVVCVCRTISETVYLQVGSILPLGSGVQKVLENNYLYDQLPALKSRC